VPSGHETVVRANPASTGEGKQRAVDLHFALQGCVTHRLTVGDAQHIAHLKAGYGKSCGQNAVDLALF
jgi:hypothetical protein